MQQTLRDDRAKPVELVRRGIAQLLELVVPPQCLLCRGRIAAAGALCAGCWGTLDLIDAPVSDRTGMPFAFDAGEEAEAVAALVDPPPWDRLRGAVRFDDASRRIVHALKYHDRHEAVAVMAAMMHRSARDLLDDADLVVPVPLHPWRLWRRRFNQSALLAQRLSVMASRRREHRLMRRVRATPPQVGLDHAARRRNVRNAFVVCERLRGEVFRRRVCLVDDVLTTGATAAACTAALKQAGAAAVDVVVFALVVQPRRDHM